MNIVRQKRFGPVDTWEFGYAPVGRPFMTVHFFLAGTNLIDTALPHMRKTFAAITKDLSIDRVLLTHHHEDHCGNADIFNKRGIPLFAHPRSIRKLEETFPIRPYQRLVWGGAPSARAHALPDTIDDRFHIVPVHSPGHSIDHVAFFLPDEGILFSGDIYLADRIAYLRADEDVLAMISSIRKLLALDFDTLLCAHRPRETGGKKHLATKLQFLEDLTGRISELAEKGLDHKSIMKALELKENRLVSTLSLGNMSMKNLITSTLCPMPDRQ